MRPEHLHESKELSTFITVFLYTYVQREDTALVFKQAESITRSPIVCKVPTFHFPKCESIVEIRESIVGVLVVEI